MSDEAKQICPACNHANPPANKYCNACAEPLSSVAPRVSVDRRFAASSVEIPPGHVVICPGCGAIAPSRRAACELCGAGLDERTIVVPPPAQDVMWTRVECAFTCRSCGQAAPLNLLDVDGELQCQYCLSTQACDMEAWRGGLAHAHAVSDLSGPNPEGRLGGPRFLGDLNPYALLGVDRAFFDLHGPSAVSSRFAPVVRHTIQMRASPGNPLCARCRSPLSARGVAGGQLVTHCDRCGDEATYALPARARELCNTVLGVLCDLHRIDRPLVGVAEGHGIGGGPAIFCPACQTPLGNPAGATVVRCFRCHTEAIVPGDVSRRLSAQPAGRTAWWLLFGGKSPTRLSIEQEARDTDDLRRSRAHQRIADAQESARRAEVDQRSVLGQYDAARTEAARRTRVYLGAAFVAVLGLAVFFILQPRQYSDPGGSAGVVGVIDAGARAPAFAAPPGGAHLALAGCACDLNADRQPGREHIQLRMRTEPRSAQQQVAGEPLSFVVDVTGQTPFQLPATVQTAPPSITRSRALDLGIACDGSTAVLVSSATATGWSLTERRAAWTVALPAPFAVHGWEPTAGVQASCHPLDLRDGTVRIPLAGRTVSLRVADGSPTRR